MKIKAQLMDKAGMRRALTRIAHEISERNSGVQNVVLVGVRRRGAVLAERLADLLEGLEGPRPDCGSIDITYFRDDRSRDADAPVYLGVELPFRIEDKILIIVDDVLFTGRTCRAAMEALFKLGRPACVQLAVLIDRGHRELPFRADYVGKNVPTAMHEAIAVCVDEIDGSDEVLLGEGEINENPV